jgi:hypothetical protein
VCVLAASLEAVFSVTHRFFCSGGILSHAPLCLVALFSIIYFVSLGGILNHFLKVAVFSKSLIAPLGAVFTVNDL